MTGTPKFAAPARRRPSEFLLPDGRRVLVALPSDVEALRKRYGTAADGAQVEVEVVVHGSDEHRHFLHQSRHHHETRHAELRERLGAAVLDELDATRAQLDAVAAQLRRLESVVDCSGGSSGSGSGTRLNTNFSKFGFDAKVRTYADHDDGDYSAGSGGDEETRGNSGTKPLSTVSTVSVAGDDTPATYAGRRDDGGDALKLFRRPVIKQYFHRGLLWCVVSTR